MKLLPRLAQGLRLAMCVLADGTGTVVYSHRVYGQKAGPAMAAGVSNSVIATAAMVYFWARVVHALSYTFAVPWVRTLAFAVGFFAQAAIAWQLLSR